MCCAHRRWVGCVESKFVVCASPAAAGEAGKILLLNLLLFIWLDSAIIKLAPSSDKCPYGLVFNSSILLQSLKSNSFLLRKVSLFKKGTRTKLKKEWSLIFKFNKSFLPSEGLGSCFFSNIWTGLLLILLIL